MATRIPVVLSQAAIAGPDARQLEEDLVAELMIEQGVDISVIPDLLQLRDGSTGLVCLQGIKGDWILLTWLDADKASQVLEQRGISSQNWLPGCVCHPAHSPAAGSTLSPSARRRPSILRMHASRSTDWYVREIRRLRDANGPTEPAGHGFPIDEASSPPAVVERRAAEPAQPFVASVDRNHAPPAEPADDLDRLLDQLDAFDA